MKYSSKTRWLLIGVLLGGCASSTQPGVETSCNGSSRYYFNSNSSWLLAYSLYNIADPANPLSHSQDGGQSGDTAFMIDTNLYVENNGSISISTIGSQIYPQYENLTAYPRHLAFAPGYIYFLRHTTYPGRNDFCWQAFDSVNELDVDRFTDTSYAATLLATVPLSDPDDIALKDSTLFVLDGAAGLKVFNVSDPIHPTLLAVNSNVQGYHLQLTAQSTLLVSSTTGLAQYDISNPASLALLSMIQ